MKQYYRLWFTNGRESTEITIAAEIIIVAYRKAETNLYRAGKIR